ncbi:hypothetical protein AAHB54_29920 [Bacillus cereus]
MEKKQELDGSLFCRKINIEDIDKPTLDLSKEYFYQAESYLRFLRENNFDEGFIKSILRIIDIKYKELYKNEYLSNKDSQKFIDLVHSALESTDFGRYQKR